MSILKRLTENIIQKDLRKEGAALTKKWEQTGLLEGLGDEYDRGTVAVLLENQAKELLREASTMAAGNVEGFAAIAFPIVRRVFGSLIANDLVSVQPMNLPSGLIFFMDFTKGTAKDGEDGATSVYGGGQVGSGITDGVDIGPGANEETSFYNLRQGYTSARGGALIADGDFTLAYDNIPLDNDLTDEEMQVLRYDPDLVYGTFAAAANALVVRVDVADLTLPIPDGNHPFAGSVDEDGNSNWGEAVLQGLTHLNIALDGVGEGTGVGYGDLEIVNHAGFTTNARLVRRLTRVVTGDGGAVYGAQNTDGTDYLEMVFVQDVAADGDFDEAGNSIDGAGAGDLAIDFAISDNLTAGGVSLGALVGTTPWQLEDNADIDPVVSGIPEIDIRVDSIAIVAETRKLKARWSPELAQDLNAYHNMDAEVELTGILSEQISLEIDQEILADLVNQSTAARLYWSRRPGLFVNRITGAALANPLEPPDFTGTVSEWYETLIETVNDVSADIHRKTLRGGANFLVVGPEVANVLEFTSGFRASVTADDDKGTVGAIRVGQINKKWDIWVDPYFPRNVILVGRKGNSFLESGYVYAPYVPLQVTPTIFDPDDFTPRKAVMTRYGKRMVRPDLYGLVIVRDLEG